MNVDRKAQGGKLGRNDVLIEDAGWPSWGSDDVLFFHRGIDEKETASDKMTKVTWRVFRYDLANKKTDPVTPEGFSAMTPAAISATTVAVATIRLRTDQMGDAKTQREVSQYRHIEIFDMDKPESVKVTQNIFPLADYYNPFVLDGGSRIGYHRSRSETIRQQENGKSVVPSNFYKMRSAVENAELIRVSGVFPTISSDGKKLAFVDNEFNAVWLADDQGLRVVWRRRESNAIFGVSWNQNPKINTLYVCVGPSFSAGTKLNIYAVYNLAGDVQSRQLTIGEANNAFPSTNPEGTEMVFRSTRDHVNNKFLYKNLYILEDTTNGESLTDPTRVKRLTDGNWTDTHCQWSPRGDWIVFSSTRDRPNLEADGEKMKLDNGLDLGYFAVFILKVSDPSVVVRVVTSGDPASGSIPGHVNHPVFSPDGRSIVVTADIAAVSAEPISMPMFLHSVRPYGDIFCVDIDPDDITKNRDIKKFTRVTHSRYEYSTPAWTQFSTENADKKPKWEMVVIPTDKKTADYTPTCPYAYGGGGQSWHMTGHLVLKHRCC